MQVMIIINVWFMAGEVYLRDYV